MSIIFIGSVGLLGTFAWLGYTHINVTTVGRIRITELTVIHITAY